MIRFGFWLRWSLRDLRRRWMVVCALALVIAIGTGLAAAFTSFGQWRRLSYDLTYQRLGMHDLSFTFDQSRVDAPTALAAVRSISTANQLRAVEGRLDLPVQLEVGELVLPGRVVGVDLASGPRVDRILATKGEALGPDDAGQRVALVERQFAEDYKLGTTGKVTLAGGEQVDLIGWAQSPTYLLNGQGMELGSGTTGVLFMSLDVAQQFTGNAGKVNQLVVTLVPGADQATVRAQIELALRTALPSATFTAMAKTDDPEYRSLYDDIDSDQQFWDLVSVLFLSAAALAVFNLANRVVSAQRREIGVGSALGQRSWTLAIRPVLFGVEIAVLGVVAGIAVGALIGVLIIDMVKGMIPIPYWITPFQFGSFARSALLGAVIPLLGIAYPVFRAVRVEPADAIRTAHIAKGGGGRVARMFGRIPLPGNSIGHLPLRHLFRAPGRSLLTATGIGASVTVLVMLFGLLDSLTAMLDTGEREQRRGAEHRTVLTLDSYYPANDVRIASIGQLDQVERARAGVRTSATALGGGHAREQRLDLVVEALDFQDPIWTPSLRDATGGQLPLGSVPGGLVLSEKAATDLGVAPGQKVTLEYSKLLEDGTFAKVSTQILVSAVHPYPLRSFAYLDDSQVGLFGLSGLVNVIQVQPAAGVSENDLRRALLDNQSIAAVAPVDRTTESMRDLVGEFTGLLDILAGFVLALTLLIAFNAASISADERAREHATMLAFGLRIRRVLANAMVESLVIGLLGTALGLVLGRISTWWMVDLMVRSTMPDLDIAPTTSAGTILLAFVLGVVAVTLAPILTLRRIRRMNLPATLRTME